MILPTSSTVCTRASFTYMSPEVFSRISPVCPYHRCLPCRRSCIPVSRALEDRERRSPASTPTMTTFNCDFCLVCAMAVNCLIPAAKGLAARRMGGKSRAEHSSHTISTSTRIYGTQAQRAPRRARAPDSCHETRGREDRAHRSAALFRPRAVRFPRN